MYESVNANFDDMGCMLNAGHVICMTSSMSHSKPRTSEERKIVMKSEILLNTTYKTHTKTCAYLIMKKNWIEKIAKLLSHSICRFFQTLKGS